MNVSNKREQNEFTHSAESEKGATKLNNENFELENMRQQMETLKKKLDQQEIVNDHLIRHSMKKTAGNISRRYYFIMAVCHGRMPADDSLQLLGIRNAKRFLHSFLDFHLHRHVG